MCLFPKGGTLCTTDSRPSPWRQVVVLSFSTARWMSKGKPPYPSLGSYEGREGQSFKMLPQIREPFGPVVKGGADLSFTDPPP